MADFIMAVLCKHPNDTGYYLFQAPAWASLNAGDDVIVSTRKGQTMANVVNCVNVEYGSDIYKMFVEMTGAREPLAKVVSRVVYYPMVYREESNEQH